MGAPSPELCNLWLARAFNAHDVDAAAAMYHPDASVVQVNDVHGMTSIARGPEAVRNTMAAYIGLDPHMDVVTHHTTVAGDIAMTRRAGPFAMLQIDADLSLDFIDAEGTIQPQHYAFLVTEAEFDAIFARVRERKLTYWADPHRREPGRINTWDDGRGVYFDDLNGHLLELITRPYGSGGTTTHSPHPLFRSAAAG